MGLIKTTTKQTKSIYFQLQFPAGFNTHFNIKVYKDNYDLSPPRCIMQCNSIGVSSAAAASAI